MANKALHWACIVVAVLIIYYALAAYMLRFSLDRMVFLHTKPEHTAETGRYHITDSRGNEVLLRYYGKRGNGCVVFFPGQHGKIAVYEKALFAPLIERGITVFTISYPGQNGAKGNGDFDNVWELVDKALARIDEDRPVKDMVFIGRSLGSMAALMAAERWHPRGLVLEGAAPSLVEGVRSYMKAKWYLRPATLLPLRRIIKNDYSLIASGEKLEHTNITVFQGTKDSITPLDKIRELIGASSKFRLFAVDGATHNDTYLRVLPFYIKTVLNDLRDMNKESCHDSGI
jgi:surfactin synthase thioesterase subunit